MYGLGKFIARLDAFSLNQYFKVSLAGAKDEQALTLPSKLSYASQLLAIFSMACAKFSVVHLMQRLSAHKSSLHRLYHFANGAIGFGFVFSILALAFQCRLPRPWIYTPGRCAGFGTLWYPVIILNIFTDFGLAFLFAPVLAKLNMRLGQRLTVIALFAIRVVYVSLYPFPDSILTRCSVCAAAIAQLSVLAPALRATDQTRKSY